MCAENPSALQVCVHVRRTALADSRRDDGVISIRDLTDSHHNKGSGLRHAIQPSDSLLLLASVSLSLCVSCPLGPHYSESPLEPLASELEEPSSVHPAGLPPESRPRLSAKRRQRSQGSTVRPLKVLPCGSTTASGSSRGRVD